MRLGERINHRRKELGLTQYEMAQRSGMTQQAISKHIRGDSLPGYDAITKLAKALEVDPAWFFGGEEGKIQVIERVERIDFEQYLRLTAAAPDLLDALQRLLGVISSPTHDAISQAQVAVRKATGEKD